MIGRIARKTNRYAYPCRCIRSATESQRGRLLHCRRRNAGVECSRLPDNSVQRPAPWLGSQYQGDKGNKKQNAGRRHRAKVAKVQTPTVS